MNIKSIALALALLAVTTATPSTTVYMGQQAHAQAITQEAKIVLEGPSFAGVGDLVVISVEKSSAKSFKWLVMPSTDNLLVIDGGKRIVFSSGEKGEYTFIVACGLGDDCDLAVHRLTIGEKPPVNILSSKIASWCESITTENKADEAVALAESFESNAARIEAGELVTAEEIVRATFETNKKALGDSHEDWMPFREGLAKELTSMAEAGGLADAQAHKQTWLMISQGLWEYAEKL
jgi:hypothetical protein